MQNKKRKGRKRKQHIEADQSGNVRCLKSSASTRAREIATPYMLMPQQPCPYPAQTGKSGAVESSRGEPMGDPTVADVDAAAAPPPPFKSDNLFMQIAIHPDGTVSRPVVPAIPASDAGAVSSRDVPLDTSMGTYIRLYLPNHIPQSTKLPVILYFHGGGFVVFSADTAFYHASCEAMAAAVPAIVASLEYRLAPEHRLPAAYDDAVVAVLWLRDVAPRDPWVAGHGDVARCFVMGSSSGANMAFNASVRTKGVDLSPAAVRGLLLHQPYLGGVERTLSEARSEDDHMLPLEANDMLWSLALPLGADRDHKFSNPTKAMAREAVVGLPRCLVSGCDGDPLIDRQRGFATWLRDSGMEVVDKTDGSGFHAAELFVPEKAEEMFVAVREFVSAGGDIDA